VVHYSIAGAARAQQADLKVGIYGDALVLTTGRE
jgi:hypothetical protein